MATFNEEDRQWLYDTMKSNGIDTGTYDDFKSSLDNDEDRQWYYDKGKELGLDLGSKEEFEDMMWEREPASSPSGNAKGLEVPDTVMSDGNTFTESQMENGAVVAPKEPAKYGTPEYAQEIINDDVDVNNPYIGMTRQQAVNAIGKRYRDEWYGQPGAYENIQKELAAYNIAKPEDYGHITAAIRNNYVGQVARQRMEDLLKNFKHVNNMTLDDIQGIMDSRETQQAIDEDLKHLGIQNNEDAYETEEEKAQARQEFQKEKDAYYTMLNKQLEKVLIDKYGYLPSSDGRSHARMWAGSLMSGGSNFHEERIRQREAMDMMQGYVKGDIDDTFAKYDEQAKKEYQEALRQMPQKSYGTSATGAASMMGSGLGQALYAGYAMEQARDYDKIIKDISDRATSIFDKMLSDEEFLKSAAAKAEAIGMSPEEYLATYAVPSFMDSVHRQFTKTAIAREMPKSKLEYVMRGLEDSVIGMLFSSVIMPKSKIAYRDMANAKYGRDANMWLEGARLAVGMASDFWMWGGWGKIGAQATKSLLNMRIMNVAAARGISREAATRIIEEEAKHYLDKRLFNHLMSHIPQSTVTMGGAQATAEFVRGTTRGEDFGDVLLNTTKTGLSSAATGAAFGATGAVSGSLTFKLAGWKRLLGKLAGLEVEAGTLYTTEELQKMMAGEDAFENPYEGMLEANVKLGFIKASANPLESARKLWNAVSHPVKTAKGMVKPDLGTLDEKDVKHIMESAGGKDLLDAITSMRPQLNKENAEREGYLTEQQVLAAADAYKNFMADPNIPWDTKQKVARLHGAIVPPAGYEVSAEIEPVGFSDGHGDWVVRTRDIDGQCIRELHFDSEDSANAEREKIDKKLGVNRANALQERIDAYDAQQYYGMYLSQEYAKIAEKMQQGELSTEELTPEERQCVYLYQHMADLETARQKMLQGQELTPDEKQLVDAYQKRFIGYTLEGHGHEAFDRQFERDHGLEEGTMNSADLSKDSALLDDYTRAMEEYLREKEGSPASLPSGEAEGTMAEGQRLLEGKTGGEAGGDSTGGNEPPASPTTPAGETAGTVERPSGEALGTKRRQAAYDRGAQAVTDPGMIAGITYDSRLAATRLQQLFQDSDPVLSHLRNDIIKAVSEGNDAEADRLIESRAGSLNARQKEAIEQYRESQAALGGLNAGYAQQVEQYKAQRKEKLSRDAASDGTITQLLMNDGTTMYLVSGDLNGQSVIAKDVNGETAQVSTDSIKLAYEMGNVNDILENDVNTYSQNLIQTITGMGNGSQFTVGAPVDIAMAGQLFSGTIEGYDQAGNIIFRNADDGSQIPLSPKDAQKMYDEAVKMKIEAQLKQEKADFTAQQQNERFGKRIAGFTEGTPDLTAKDTDPKVAAEYMESTIPADKTSGHTDLLKSIQSEIDRLNEVAAEKQSTINELNKRLAIGELAKEEMKPAHAEAVAAKDDAEARRRKWGEIRQELMTDEERQKFESDRQKHIKKAIDAAKKEVKPMPDSPSRHHVPSANDLLNRFEEQGDADDFVESIRKYLKEQYRDNLYPEISTLRDKVSDYRQGLIDMSEEDLHDLMHDLTALELEESHMVKESQELSKLASSLGRLYAQRENANLTPHERKMRQLDKETNREKKLKLAKEVYAEDEEALAVLNDTEPQDIYEHIADNLGEGSLNWEGMQRGEHYVRGLRDELGKDKKRGIGRDSDTKGFNFFLAPEGQGKGIEEVVHSIAEGSPYSTEDVRNALIDMLTSASKPTDISHRIVDDRIARAEEIYNANLEREREAEEDAKREAEDAAIMEMTGMTPEEYDAFISDLEQRLAEQDGYRTSDEYFNQIAEENDRTHEGSAGGGQESGAPKEQGKEVKPTGAEAAGETGDTVTDVVKKKLSEITSKYHSLAPVEIISLTSENIPEYIAGDIEKLKEKKIPAAYYPVNKKIYIFAENLEEGKEELFFFHENLHRGLEQYYGNGLREIAEAYWDASISPASEQNKSIISESYADQPDDIKEEYLVNTLAKNMTTGHVDRLIDRLLPEHQEIINNILRNIGYDRAAEEAERTAKEGSHSGRTETEGLANNEERGTQRGVSHGRAKETAAIAEEYADQPDEIKEEYFAHTMAKNMAIGKVDKLIARLNPEHQEIINNILHNINYDREKEAAERAAQEATEQLGESDSKRVQNSELGARGVESPIQGLDGYTEKDVTDIVRNHFNELIGEDGIDIVDMKVIGSRVNGDANENSDLDVLLEYKGDISEDSLFNILNDEENRLTIEGIPVDINPITKGKSGTIAEFLDRNKDYDKSRDKLNMSFPERLAKAKEDTNTNPTEEQKKAGNYKMGHISFGGYKMSIENPKGSTRSGVDANGKPWSIKMQDTYGYIREKYGTDGDHLDFFINDDADLDKWNGRVFIVDQKNEDGTFDEHKVMYGYSSWQSAKTAYERNYEPGWWDNHVMQMMGVKKVDFDKWMEDSDHKHKPFADYFRTKHTETISDNVDQLLADVAERQNIAKQIEPSYTETQLKKMSKPELVNLKKQRQNDFQMNRYILKAAGVEGRGDAKETQLRDNMAQAEADMQAIQTEIDRKELDEKSSGEQQEMDFGNIDFMIGDVAREDETNYNAKRDENIFPFGRNVVSLQSESARETVDGQKATLPKTAPWREGVEEVTIHTTLNVIRKKYGELHEKAKAGDIEAAVELVLAVAKPEKVKAIAQQHPNAKVAYVHAEEQTGRNQIPAQYAGLFEDEGLEVSDIVQTNKPNHTGSDRIGRFVRRARFDGEVEPGTEYIIVDDHVTMGGTLRDLKDYIESKGGKVVAVTTLTASAGGTKLRPTDEQIQQLKDKGITNEQLKELGIADSIDGLTRREAAEILVLADKGGDSRSSRGREEIIGDRPSSQSEVQSSAIEEPAEASIVSLPRIDDNGLNLNTPLGRKLSRLKKEAGPNGLVGYTDSKTGDYVILGNDADIVKGIAGKYAVYGEQDGMHMLRIPSDNLDMVSPKVVKNGYKMAFTTDEVDATDKMLDEVERRKEVASQKESEKRVKEYLDKHIKGQDAEVRKRATKAVLKAMDKAGVPYKVVSKEEERQMMQIFSMMNQAAVKAFCRRADIRSTSRHGFGRYCVYNMADPFAVPMYHEKLSNAKEDVKQLKRMAPQGAWEILDIGYADEVQDNQTLTGKAADMNLAELQADIETWHGSGAKFDAFDHSHMGEGEGNRVYGWGTYVTEVEGVGKLYADIASKGGWTYKGEDRDTIEERRANEEVPEGRYNSDDRLVSLVLEKLNRGYDFDETIRSFIEYTQNAINDTEDPKYLEGFKEQKAFLESLKEKDFERSPRYLYKVDIPDDTGKNYLYGFKEMSKAELRRIYSLLAEEVTKDEPANSIYRKELKKELASIVDLPTNGNSLYGTVQAYLGSDKEASKFLHDIGYVGIKYPVDSMNGGKRSGGKSNYVIFNEDDAKIVDTIQFMVETPYAEAPVFFSNAMKAVEGIKQEKATPEQWLKMIEKAGGLKAGEDKWIGLSDFLKEHKGKTITKEEVMDYIRENEIMVEEQDYSETIDIDNNPKMKELRDEFDKIKLEIEGNQSELEVELDKFEEEMYDKYGSGWHDKLNDEETAYAEKFDALSSTEGTADEKAFREMAERYGDDFESGFEVDGNGRLVPVYDYNDDISDAAKFYLEIDDKPINDTRLAYTTDGLDNKREIALVVPTIEPWNESDKIHFGDAGNGTAVAWVRFGDTTLNPGNDSAEHKEAKKQLDDYYDHLSKKYGFTDDPLSFDMTKLTPEEIAESDRLQKEYEKTFLQGEKKVLVIDEIQSKRHQEGREKGYMTMPPANAPQKIAYENAQREYNDYSSELRNKYGRDDISYGLTDEERSKLDNLFDKRFKAKIDYSKYLQENGFGAFSRSNVPDAPFEKNWHELAMKRMLRYAAENGYDKIAWTTGAQQAERYSLAKVFDYVEREDNPSVNGRRFVFGGGNVENFTVDENGKVIDATMSEAVGKPLSDVVGKDLAVKMMGLENGEMIDNEHLTIGGEGMKGFYDDMLPRFMNKYGKKWGVKVSDINLPSLGGNGLTMHSIDVTPEMRESVMQGQPMFQKEGKKIMGWSDGKQVYLTEAGLNPNTPLHETTHLWDKWCQKEKPELWQKLVDAMKKTAMWEEISKNPNYRNIWNDDSRMASEVHARLSGARGEEEFMKAAFKKDTPQSIINEVKSVLRKFWESILRLFGKATKTIGDEWSSLDAIIRMPLRDLLNQDFEKVMKVAEGESDAQVEGHVVEDKNEIARLDAEPKEVGYRNVVVNEDGTLGSPMANRLGKKGEGKKATTMFEYGKWERSDEHPELANENGKIDLIKPDGKPVEGVDYNPYIHIRPNKVNKQFKQAWERPNLIYVETEYPKSELNGEYRADKAAKAVGKHKWGTQGESLILSRWDKPVRMVPWEEVADDWEKEFKGRGVEFDIVPPKLLPILAERGIEILPPHKGMGKACQEAYQKFLADKASEHSKPIGDSGEIMYRHITPMVEQANSRFNEELERQINDPKFPKDHVYKLGKPSSILLSTGFPNDDIELSASHLKEKSEAAHHPFKLEDVRDLVKAINDPIAVFNYGNKDKSQNVIVEIQKDGKNFVVGIHFNQDRHGMVVSDIRGLYPKDNAEWLNWITQGKLLYADKEKIQNLISQQRRTLAEVGYLDLNSVAKIIKDFENPKLSEEKMQELFPEYAIAAEETGDMLSGQKVILEVEGPEEGTLGWYDPNDNTVHIVIPEHANVDEVKRTVCHEKLGHEGLVALLGSQEAVNKFGDFIYKSASKALRMRMLDKADEEGYGLGDRLRYSKAAQEVFGDIAADGPRTADEFSLWRKVKHYIIKLAKLLHLNVRGLVNDHDLRYYVLKTGEALKRWSKLSEKERANLSSQSSNFDIMRNRGGKPRKRKNESEAQYMQHLMEWEKWRVAEETAAANNDPKPDVKAINEKWDEAYYSALDEWRRENGISEEQMEKGLGASPKRGKDETPQEYAVRVTDYEMQRDLLNTAPDYSDYVKKAHDEYKDAYTDWKRRYDLQEEENVDIDMYEGIGHDGPETDADMEAEARMERDLGDAVGIELDSEGAKRHAKLAVIERRKNLESNNAEDAIWIHNFMKKSEETAKAMSGRTGNKITGKMLREALPFIIEGTYFEEIVRDEDGNIVGINDIRDQLPIKEGPELEDLVTDVKEWYHQFYFMLEDAGLKGDAGFIENYVNHVWDKGKSDPKAWEKYVENYQRTKSPNMRHREIDTYQEGIDVGLVPKYKDIADMIAHYSRQNNEAVANKRFLDDLYGYEVAELNSDGETVSVLPLVTREKPDALTRDRYAEYYVPGVGDVYVIKEAQKRFASVFGTMRTPDVANWLENLAKAYDTTGSVMKKIQLSISGFHIFALTEVAMAQMRPDRAMRALFKYLLYDSFKADTLPAYAHPEDFQFAASHLVQLGATQDYAAADVNNITGKLREMMHELYESDSAVKKAAGAAGSVPAIMMDWVNKGIDKMLWNFLHDGLKIACFKMFAEQVDARVKKEGLSEEMREKLLDEAGQYVNDTFGGQYFELLNISPAMVKWLRRALLSPDWLISTQRHFMANFGFGSLYSDSSFKNYLKFNADNIKRVFGSDVAHDELRRFRSKNAKQCYILGVCFFFYTMMNILNAFFRRQDEKEQQLIAEEQRKTNPDYRSPYELAYPDGMKWYDYTMLGNGIGQQTHLYVGRYDDGSETYVRWGKQFREFPEMFIGRHGVEFPTPLIERMMGKANPMVSLTRDNLGSLGVWGFSNSSDIKEIQAKYGKTIGVLAMNARHFMPFSIPTQADKEFKAIDLIMPSQKGFTRYKTVDFFKTYIQAGDMEGVVNTYNAAVMNNIDAEECLKAAITTLKATQRKEMSDGVTDLSIAAERFDKADGVSERNLMRKKIQKYLAGDQYKLFTRDEAINQVNSFLDGEDMEKLTEKNQNYLMLQTSEDVIGDWKLNMLKRKGEEYADKIEEARNSGDDQRANALALRYTSWLQIKKLAGSYEYRLNKLKGLLGSDKSTDAETMQDIRDLREEIQHIIDSLQAPK